MKALFIWGLESLKDILELFFAALSSMAILIAVITFRTTRKQHYFEVINNCNLKFQNLLSSGKKFTAAQKRVYLDLVNEQLFYIENFYVPVDVSVEWIDGIIDFLPLLNSKMNEIPINPNSFFGCSFEEDIYIYPRISNSFVVSIRGMEGKNLTQPEHFHLRKKVLKQLYANIIKPNIWTARYFRNKKAKSYVNKLYSSKRNIKHISKNNLANKINDQLG